MTKMLRLIKNEMVKLARRKSIWIMLVVTLAIAVGTAVLYNYSKVSDEPSGEEYLVSQWKEEITKLERFFAADHYYSDRYADESLRGKQYRNRSAMLQYLVDNQYSPYDWRYTSGIIEQLFYHKLQKDVNPGYDMSEHDRLQTLIDIDNWQQYYLEQVDAFLAENLKMYPMAQEQVRDAAWYEYNYRTEGGFRPGDELWRDNLITSVVSAKLSLAYLAQQEYERTHPEYIAPSKGDPTMEKLDLTMEQIEENRAAILDKLAVATYRLDNEIKADIGYIFGEDAVVSAGEGSLFWENLAASSDYIIGVGALIIIVAGLIVASEFSGGTIKFLLVSPVKRWKIVTAKYITVLLLSLMLTLLMYISSAAASLIVFGGYGATDVIVLVENGVAWGVSPYLMVLGSYGWAFIEVVVVATMAFALSSLMRSTAVSIGIGLLAYLSGTALVELFAAMGIDFGRYVLFANLDLPAIMEGASVFPNQTLTAALINITAHMAVFLLTAWDGFVRREI